MDPLLRPSEQTSELGRQEPSWREIEGLSQPKGGEWKPDETLGADAELSRSLTKVVQQLQWLQAQREATAIDELVLPQRQGDAGSAAGASEAQGKARLLLVLHTGVGNWQQLAANLPPETDLLLLDQQHSGLQQIDEHLSRQAPAGGYGGLMLVMPPGPGRSLDLGSVGMRTLKAHEAKTRFWRLIETAHAGETIVITKGEGPSAKLVLLEPAHP